MQKIIRNLDNLEAFLTEAEARADYKKDTKLIMSTYNLTQREMAKQFGVSQMTICRWLKGRAEPRCLIVIHLTAEKLRQQP